jgi:sulfopropanediol 3-dehydrogenase
MIRHLKTALTAEQRAETDSKVRETVEGILGEIEKEGDAAVRRLSDKFDNYTPENFRLIDSEIEVVMFPVANFQWWHPLICRY